MKLTLVFAWLAVVVLMAYGWVLNIISLINFEGPVAQAGFLEILRVVGVFVAPLGSILGLAY